METRKTLNKVNTTELVSMALLSAILLIGQVGMSYLPNIEIVSLLVYIYTQIYRKKAFLIIYVFVFLEGCIYGFGLWWFGYLYIWSILALYVIFSKKQPHWGIRTFLWLLVFHPLLLRRRMGCRLLLLGVRHSLRPAPLRGERRRIAGLLPSDSGASWETA